MVRRGKEGEGRRKGRDVQETWQPRPPAEVTVSAGAGRSMCVRMGLDGHYYYPRLSPSAIHSRIIIISTHTPRFKLVRLGRLTKREMQPLDESINVRRQMTQERRSRDRYGVLQPIILVFLGIRHALPKPSRHCLPCIRIRLRLPARS